MFRTNIRKLLVVSAAIAVLVMPLSSHAADRTHPCAQITDDGQRLSCYDSDFGKPAVTVAPKPAANNVVATPPAVASPPAAAPPVVANTPEPPAVAKEAAPAKGVVTSSIAALSYTSTRRFVVSLANGQIWVQNEADPKIQIKVGESVTVAPGSWSSFKMTTQTGFKVGVSMLK